MTQEVCGGSEIKQAVQYELLRELNCSGRLWKCVSFMDVSSTKMCERCWIIYLEGLDNGTNEMFIFVKKKGYLM